MRERNAMKSVISELIATECPEIAPECFAGEIDANRYRESARALIIERLPKFEVAYTYGSVAKGNPRPLSDVDVYVIAEVETPLCIKEIYLGVPVELRVLSRATADSLLSGTELTRKAVFFARSLEESSLVAGDESLLADLKYRALAWLARCPTSLSEKAVFQHRTRITSRVFDLADPELCSYRRVRAVAEVADSIRVLSNAEKGIFQGRNLLDDLAPIWPERAAALAFAIDQALGRDDATPLVKLAITSIGPFGGFMLQSVTEL